MIFFKIRKSWKYVGSTRLLRAFLLYGAAYYFVLGLAFGLEIIASMSDEVGGSISVVSKKSLLLGYSFTTP